MTPLEFRADVGLAIKDSVNEEEEHKKTDELMENLLIELGYGAGIKLIRKTYRWYA